jgi:glycosyltransferase involved in cell wall biosynthesis
MRVLQAMAGMPHGGAEAFFARLAPALTRAGLEQKLLIRHDANRKEALEKAGIETLELPFGGLFDFHTARAFRHQIRTFRPDVVLTWMSRASRFCPPRFCPGGEFVHVGRLGGYYNLKYYRHCDHLIGNTRDLVAYMTGRGWSPERVHYLPNFVDAKSLPAIPRSQFSTPDDAPLILALGRLHENKAFDVLIRAVSRLPDSFLWIAGEGPLQTELRTLADTCGVADRIRFLGWRDDVAALYATADIFVCPSRIEPLGNVIIEAWAQGVPVVAAKSAGPLALIEPGGNGLLTELDNDEELSVAIARILNDRQLHQTLVSGGRASYEADFTEDQVVCRYLDFFKKVAA